MAGMDSLENIKPPRRLSLALAAAFAVAAVYLLPLAVVFLDEAVFHTYFCSHYLPVWMGHAFELAYPFLSK